MTQICQENCLIWNHHERENPHKSQYLQRLKQIWPIEWFAQRFSDSKSAKLSASAKIIHYGVKLFT